jgi:hypothetical protein
LLDSDKRDSNSHSFSTFFTLTLIAAPIDDLIGIVSVKKCYEQCREGVDKGAIATARAKVAMLRLLGLPERKSAGPGRWQPFQQCSRPDDPLLLQEGIKI